MNYTSILKSRPFFFNEQKKVIDFHIKGFNEDEIREKIIEKNIFKFNSINRKKEVASTVLKRLKVLDVFLMSEFDHSSLAEQKFIVLYTILKTDRLFFEFMVEVFREKYLVKAFELKDYDFESFFREKAIQSDRIDNWQEYTHYKLKQVYIRILFEAGLINNQEERQILKPIVAKEIVDHLVLIGDEIYAKALLGGL
jgi:HD-GYP domain-containing protein (c-di-GMP phosphodiesterase class II)